MRLFRGDGAWAARRAEPVRYNAAQRPARWRTDRSKGKSMKAGKAMASLALAPARPSLYVFVLLAACVAGGCDSAAPVAAKKPAPASASDSCGEARQAGALVPCELERRIDECEAAPATHAGAGTCRAVMRDMPAGTMQARVLVEMADIAKARKRYGEALEHADAAIAMAPEYAHAWHKRGQVNLQAGRFERAHADIEKAQGLDPADGHILNTLARSYHVRGEPAMALDAINRALPRLTRSRGAMAEAFSRRCRYRADLDIELAAALDDCAAGALVPDSVPPNITHFRRGLVYYRLERYADAVAEFDQAMRPGKDNSYPLYMRSLGKRALGQADGARSDLDAALREDPEVAGEFTRYR
jgi:tetratricopeptide (TPR) repeat protein